MLQLACVRVRACVVRDKRKKQKGAGLFGAANNGLNIIWFWFIWILEDHELLITNFDIWGPHATADHVQEIQIHVFFLNEILEYFSKYFFINEISCCLPKIFLSDQFIFIFLVFFFFLFFFFPFPLPPFQKSFFFSLFFLLAFLDKKIPPTLF